MSDRSSKPYFAVSRNLKNSKYHFIEAKLDKLTKSSDIADSDTTQVSSDTSNSVSSSTWLCVTFNMKNTSRKMWQTSLLFLEPLKIQKLKRKSGGHDILYPPHLKKWGDIPPVSPPQKVGGHVPGRTPSFSGECSQLFIHILCAFLSYSNHKQFFLFNAFTSITSAPRLRKILAAPLAMTVYPSHIDNEDEWCQHAPLSESNVQNNSCD